MVAAIRYTATRGEQRPGESIDGSRTNGDVLVCRVFEHTAAVLKEGPEVLTAPLTAAGLPP